LHGAVARFVVDGFGQSFGLLFWKFNANSCLLSKFTFIRDKKGRLILLYCLILQLPPIMSWMAQLPILVKTVFTLEI